ncbi:MAG: methyltransferase domain-containing protein [Candidatus Hydrogenedentota bacterium]|nr:MAG: methyltransferase domain-containing protein [Candidatus Hydrogenedentota bacterium]
MSYIFMKILERKPASYDAGIAKYSAGDFAKVRKEMRSLVKPGDRVLDVGCGPGTFATECAKKGATVEAVDISPEMLYAANLAAKKAGVEEKIRFQNASATEIEADHGSFDLVVFSLSLSELREVEQWVAMHSAFDFLKPGGKLVVADEVVPRALGPRVWYQLRRLMLLAITYLVTKAITRPVNEMEGKFRACGFDVERIEAYERGSLKLVVGTRIERKQAPEALSPDRLPGWTEALGKVCSYFTLAFKAVPIRTGLYKFGNPSEKSPVLVTANYLLTFASVKKHLRGLDCYLLVIDTRGINVWCSAGKGNFSAEEIHNSLRATRAGDIIETRTLILPKLSATGVKYRDVKQLTGWDAVFGPVYARDIPEYLGNGCVTGRHVKRVRFAFGDRLWVAVPFAFFVGFLALLPLLVFRRLYSPMIPVIAVAAAFAFPLAFYRLPTNQFFKKGLTLGLIGAAGGVLFLLVTGAPAKEMVQWSLIIVGLTTFIAMDFSGMSPVSNYSRINEEYHVVVPLLGLIIASYVAVSFLWG